MDGVGARTLGEYFSKYNPFATMTERIRGTHTVRAMYRDEFERLWEAQATYYPEILTPKFRQVLLFDEYGLFWQRGLKSQSHLVGDCELESGEKRAPMASLEAQRFRYLQTLNNTRILFADGREPRCLMPNEREKLIEKLEMQDGLSMTEAKKTLGLKSNDKFNLGEGGETRFIGNKTAARFIAIIGDAWANATPEEQSRMVGDWLKSRDDAAPMAKTILALRLNDKIAKKLAEIRLEPTYCAYSMKALRKLLPDLREGFSLYDARINTYGEMEPPAPLDYLTAVIDDKDIRNPVVQRSLTELRKVVNAIVRRYGKPAMIRIELARDMKKSDKDRQEIWKRNRNRESLRKKAEDRAKEIISEPTRNDIEKVLLLDECGGYCPYTGKPISISALLGEHREFDIEHIIPFSRCFDDSFANKTLCHTTANIAKGNRTPFEAFSGDAERWEQILKRVKAFKGDASKIKLERFLMEDSADWQGFVNSQLNDTRYASKLAGRFVGTLYGGKVDAAGKLRVQVGKGGATAHIRNLWRLNSILNDGGLKSRDDHRHHAVDAIAIAVTDPGLMHQLSKAAARAKERGERWFGRDRPQPPWPTFYGDARRAIDEVIVSHRASHKVNTALHEQTIYSPEKIGEDGKKYVHVRRTLGGNLRKSDLSNIVDDKVRQAICDKLRALGYDPDKIEEAKLQKAFGLPENLPALQTRDGRLIPIKKVRVRKSETVMKIGKKGKERNVSTGSNSHIEVFEVTDARGRVKWDGWTVTSFEAMQRLRKGLPVVNRVGKDENWKFRFSLAGGDIIELNRKDGSRGLYIVKVITVARVGGKEYARINYSPINVSKPTKLETSLLNPLREELQCRKVAVTTLGEVHDAND